MNNSEFERIVIECAERIRKDDFCAEDEAIVYAKKHLAKRNKKNLEMLKLLNDAINENVLLKAENDNWRKHGTSLNEIKANAIEEFVEDRGDELTSIDDWYHLNLCADKYAQKLRGEK